jgi:hypothetical protein
VQIKSSSSKSLYWDLLVSIESSYMSPRLYNYIFIFMSCNLLSLKRSFSMFSWLLVSNKNLGSFFSLWTSHGMHPELIILLTFTLLFFTRLLLLMRRQLNSLLFCKNVWQKLPTLVTSIQNNLFYFIFYVSSLHERKIRVYIF